MHSLRAFLSLHIVYVPGNRRIWGIYTTHKARSKCNEPHKLLYADFYARMAHYIGFKPSKDQEVSKELQAKGINLLRCSLRSSHIVAVPTFVQPYYRQYTSHLPAFIRATIEKKKINLRDVGHLINVPIDDCFPIPQYGISVAYKGRHAAASAERVKENAEEANIKGQSVFLIRDGKSVNTEILRLDGINPDAACPDEFLNRTAWLGVRLLQKIATGYLLTNFYPAFKDPNHAEELRSHVDDISSGSKHGRDLEIIEDLRHSKSLRTEEAESQASGARTRSVTDSDTVTIETVASIMRKHNNLCAIHTRNPTPFGRLADMPGHFGLFLVYESQLQHYEGDFIPSVIQEYFLGCIGSSRDEIHKAFTTLKGACGTIGRTEVGKVLNHMFLAIRTAIESQAMAYPVFEQERYLGSAILGYGYSININGTLVAPVSPQELHESLQSLPTHIGLLLKIHTMVNWRDVNLDDMDELNDAEKRIKYVSDLTAMDLRMYLLKRALTEEKRLEIGRLCEGLSFPLGKKSIFLENLIRAITLITNTAEIIDQDWPIHPSKILSNDRDEVIWSAFGFLAPTLRPAGGIAISPTATKIKFHDFREKADKETPFKRFFVRQVALSQAVIDLKEVKRTGEILAITTPRRSGKFSDREFTGGEFSSLMGAISRMIGATMPAESSASITEEVITAGGAFDF